MRNKIINLQRQKKRIVFLLIDMLLIPISLYFAFALRKDTFFPFDVIRQSGVLFIILTLLGGGIIYFLKLPRIKLNAFETRAMLQVGLAAVSLTITAILISLALLPNGLFSTLLIFGSIFFLFSVSVRGFGLYLLLFILNQARARLPVLIYGGGSAGVQIATALRQSNKIHPIAFIDDNPNLHGVMMAGLPVYPSTKIEKLIRKSRIKRILIAMPSVPSERLKAIISDLSRLSIQVQVLPSYMDGIAENKLIENFRNVTHEDLLGRDKVDLGIPEIAKTYAGRVVMVTGAGGSIGSELCRQLLNCKPACIVLFDQGEYQLYSIDQDIRPLAEAAGVQVITKLGSITNASRVAKVIAEEKVEIILHAAAYKHVPLVEDNELEGARNNVLGTQIVAEAADKAQIERFILVSTDKAVRPTNVMGATKRMAELVVQDIQKRSSTTKFAIVRFGNVMGSSGSVLPLFEKQIKYGGPVTVTHTDVTRFFMTITEASRLVLLVGSYARGGDVFVLDMGAPRKIIDIAHQMITLSGRKVVNSDTGEGDIEIKITGLRPGEKLYEELLIDIDDLQTTPHKKIFKAEENMLSQIEIAAMLREIKSCVVDGDVDRFRQLIQSRVEGYHQNLDAVNDL